MKKDEIYIARICDSARKILEATKGMNEESFTADEVTTAAVILWLSQIGEIAKRISTEAREQYPSIPWKDIVGFRDMAVHEYYNLSIPDVWLTVTKDIPVLLGELSTQ